MNISIKTKSGKRYKLDLESSHSIETNIKDNESTLRVETKTGKRYKLDVESSDGVDSIETNIKDNDSTFRVVLRSDGVKQILRGEPVRQLFVKTLIGKSAWLDVENCNTIEGVMEKIGSVLGYPPKRQTLIFGGAELQIGRTLADYGIQNDCTLHLVLRLMG